MNHQLSFLPSDLPLDSNDSTPAQTPDLAQVPYGRSSPREPEETPAIVPPHPIQTSPEEQPTFPLLELAGWSASPLPEANSGSIQDPSSSIQDPAPALAHQKFPHPPLETSRTQAPGPQAPDEEVPLTQLNPPSGFHPLEYGAVISSPGAHFTYQIIGPCCRLFDREELPWPCCRLQWRGKEPSWRRIGRRLIPDMAVKNSPSYAVEILEPGYVGQSLVLTLYSVKFSPELKAWWYSRRLPHNQFTGG